MLILQLINSLANIVQYFFLGAFSAMLTNLITGINTYILSKYAKDNKKVPLHFFIIYSAIIIIAGIFTYKGLISLFPIVLSIVTAYITWQDNLKIYRAVNICIALLWIVYNLSVGAYTIIIVNMIHLTSAIIAVYRLDIKKQNNATA